MWLAVVHDHEDELAVVYDREDDGDRCARRRGLLGRSSQCAELAVVYDHEDDGDRCARRRGLLGRSSQCAVRQVDCRHLERLHHAIPREWRVAPAVHDCGRPRRAAGTWRIGLRCAGTLRLKDISSGYHHYYRVAGANAACAALGVDCLKRVGAQMLDVFVPDSGPDDSVNLRRVR